MTRLSKYTLQEPPLGRGGYGTVYKAYDEVLKVERAIKVLHPQLAADPENRDRAPGPCSPRQAILPAGPGR